MFCWKQLLFVILGGVISAVISYGMQQQPLYVTVLLIAIAVIFIYYFIPLNSIAYFPKQCIFLLTCMRRKIRHLSESQTYDEAKKGINKAKDTKILTFDFEKIIKMALDNDFFYKEPLIKYIVMTLEDTIQYNNKDQTITRIIALKEDYFVQDKLFKFFAKTALQKISDIEKGYENICTKIWVFPKGSIFQTKNSKEYKLMHQYIFTLKNDITYSVELRTPRWWDSQPAEVSRIPQGELNIKPTNDDIHKFTQIEQASITIAEYIKNHLR
jgi:hypothetical protein